MALLEVMSFGIACVICSPNQQHEVIKDEQTGLFVAPGNISEFSCVLK